MDHDPERIGQVLSNLLSNAIKFTPEGGSIIVVLQVQPSKALKHSEVLSIRVEDTGIGIPARKLPFIFDRYYQVSEGSTLQNANNPGTGIGLALTKKIVELKGGEITVESELGKGSIFTVHLPVTRKEPLSGVQPLSQQEIYSQKPSKFHMPTLRSNHREHQILLVEDNPDLLHYLVEILKEDYNLDIAIDGEEGIAKAVEGIPDLIITDIMMPGKDGFELCETVKKHEWTSHIPVIMLTAKAEVESRLRGLKQGAEAYLEKPFLPEELKVRIHALLEQRKKLQAYYRAQLKDVPNQGQSPLTSKAQQINDPFLQKVDQIINVHLVDEELSVEFLANELFVSTSKLYRKLKAITGLSSQQYIRHIRLMKAKELLKDPELSVSEVALSTGFNDPDHFSRLFKKETGKTPSAFRNSHFV